LKVLNFLEFLREEKVSRTRTMRTITQIIKLLLWGC